MERVIAVFKLAKGLLVAAVAAGLLGGQRWLGELRVDPDNRYIHAVLAKISSLSPQQLQEIGLGGFLYAAVFLVEGIGLWMGKRWAEWLTVVVTGSFVPLEVYELVKQATALRAVALAVNIAIVAYLVVRLRQRQRRR